MQILFKFSRKPTRNGGDAGKSQQNRKKDNIFGKRISLLAFATIIEAPRQLHCKEDQGKKLEIQKGRKKGRIGNSIGRKRLRKSQEVIYDGFCSLSGTILQPKVAIRQTWSFLGNENRKNYHNFFRGFPGAFADLSNLKHVAPLEEDN